LDKYRKGGKNKNVRPPFAGITLIRFSGYFSAITPFGEKAPR